MAARDLNEEPEASREQPEATAQQTDQHPPPRLTSGVRTIRDFLRTEAPHCLREDAVEAFKMIRTATNGAITAADRAASVVPPMGWTVFYSATSVGLTGAVVYGLLDGANSIDAAVHVGDRLVGTSTVGLLLSTAILRTRDAGHEIILADDESKADAQAVPSRQARRDCEVCPGLADDLRPWMNLSAITWLVVATARAVAEDTPRLFTYMAATFALAVWSSSTSSRSSRSAVAMLVLGLVTVVAGTLPAASRLTDLELVMKAGHASSAALWLGGLLVMAVLVAARWTTDKQELVLLDGDHLAQALTVYSRVAGFSVAVLAGTGLVLAAHRGDNLISTGEGRLVLAKVSLLILLVVCGWIHRACTLKLLTGTSNPAAFLVLALTELAVMGCVIVLSSALVTRAFG